MSLAFQMDLGLFANDNTKTYALTLVPSLNTPMGRKEYFQFYEGKKMGIKTMEDGVIIPAIYDFVEPYSDGLFNVTKADSHAYFDNQGRIVLPFQNKYESYGNFSEGLARVRINDKWGYINKSGQEIIMPQFHFAEDFSNDFAVVRNVENKHGAIDKTGKLVIDYQFLFLTKFENGYAKFGDYRTYGLIDKSGKIVAPQEYIYIGPVENSKAKVQIKEGEKYKEGTLTIGGIIEWNNDLDKLNEFNLRQKKFITRCEDLLQAMYEDSCPCAYQRFRNFIQWNKPVRFLDQGSTFFNFFKLLSESR